MIEFTKLASGRYYMDPDCKREARMGKITGKVSPEVLSAHGDYEDDKPCLIVHYRWGEGSKDACIANFSVQMARDFHNILEVFMDGGFHDTEADLQIRRIVYDHQPNPEEESHAEECES